MFKLKRLDVGQVGDVTVARFRDDRISEADGIEEIAQELFSLVEGENPRKLVVSLATVDFVSSAALGKLITLNRKVTASGGALKLSDMNADIALVFSVTQLDRVFDIEKEEDHAVRAFGEVPPRPPKALGGPPKDSWRSLWAPHPPTNTPV